MSGLKECLQKQQDSVVSDPFRQVLQLVHDSDAKQMDDFAHRNNFIIAHCSQFWLDFLTRLEAASTRCNPTGRLASHVHTYRQPFLDPVPLLVHLILPSQWPTSTSQFNPTTATGPLRLPRPNALPSLMLDLDSQTRPLDWRFREAPQSNSSPITLYLGAQTLKPSGNQSFRLPQYPRHGRNRLPDLVDHVVFLYGMVDKLSRLTTSLALDSVKADVNFMVEWMYSVGVVVARDVHLVMRHPSSKMLGLQPLEMVDQSSNAPETENDLDSISNYSPLKTVVRGNSACPSPLVNCRSINSLSKHLSHSSSAQISRQGSEANLSLMRQLPREVPVQRISSDLTIGKRNNELSRSTSPTQSVSSMTITNSFIEGSVSHSIRKYATQIFIIVSSSTICPQWCGLLCQR
ncbi:hypothetical protein Ciccas_010564 [Cichlidogyrus casuarinus]|uniref:Uncharacterized protein n=1 Tax=Cichlidogyrus casuarinus TaxID=1844966 RepID=A0ABD2PUX8_9PLAT